MIKDIHNYKLHLDPKARGIQSWLRGWRQGTPDREPAFEHIIRQEVKPGMAVFELGANVGYLTFMMWTLLKGEGEVFAIEPDPRNFKYLKESVSLNKAGDIVQVFPYAIDNKDGDVTFYLGTKSNLSSIKPTKNTTDETVTVKTFTIDTLFKDRNFPNFIKMDIEGHEVEALEGSLETFSNQFPCKILIEVHPQFLEEPKRFEDIIRELLKLGFNYRFVVSAAVAVPDKFREKGYTPKQVFPGGWPRGLYDNITNDDAIYLSCYPHKQDCGHKGISPKICRSVMLERK